VSEPVEIGQATLHLGDCLEVLRGMADNSVDAVVTDPPYFKVKGEHWDRQWETREGFLQWLDGVMEQFARVLRPNGSLYLFASPQMAAHVEVLIGQRFNVLNRIHWVKASSDKGDTGQWSRANKESLRALFPQTEAIIFAEHKGADNMAKGEAGYVAKCDELRGFVFEPLRAYLAGEMERSGHTLVSVNKAWQAWKGGNGGMSSHWFTTSQWVLPTAKNYAWLRELFNLGGGEYLRREYEDLRREYEDLRREYEDLRREYEDLRKEYEDLRRPFAVTPDVPYTDVWRFRTVPHKPGKHPCEKPEDLMRHILRCSMRPGGVVLDPFMGSGSTGKAALLEGFRFVGIEREPEYLEIAKARIQAVL
jgi:site-specific DNA-methyltransferase (adenine-specific)